MESIYLDFGDGFDTPIISNNLSDRFGENPFSILHTTSGKWMDCERDYRKLGIRSELGRDVSTFNLGEFLKKTNKGFTNVSIFSARLSQLMYQWFCPVGGSVIDPFAGGSVRGVVAGINGCDYTGIDIRPEQIDEDLKQTEELDRVLQRKPEYICGDSRTVLDTIDRQYDLLFTCPPYSDLEIYSDIDGDISNMGYDDFMVAYSDIIRKGCSKVRDGGFAVIVVAEIRDRHGNLRGFVPDTIRAFQNAGMNYYNEIILENSSGTACLRSKQFNSGRKIIKIHQNVLVFTKGRPDMTRDYRMF